MSLILSIETSTRNCSVGLSLEGEPLLIREASSDQYIHSEKLHVFIQSLFEDSGKSANDLAAVAVGKGPGSFTGLRIGVAAAKGLCYPLQKPLISIDSLSILSWLANESIPLKPGDQIIPMIDARRMEVYCAQFDIDGTRLTDVEARILDKDSFSECNAPNIHLLGDGAPKAKEVLVEDRFILHNIPFPNAASLGKLAYSKYVNKEFEDIAYFEPWYFKDFIAGKPKKML